MHQNASLVRNRHAARARKKVAKNKTYPTTGKPHLGTVPSHRLLVLITPGPTVQIIRDGVVPRLLP